MQPYTSYSSPNLMDLYKKQPAPVSAVGNAPVDPAAAGGMGTFGAVASGVNLLSGLQESGKQKSLAPLASSLMMTALLFG